MVHPGRPTPPETVAALLESAAEGDEKALDELMPLVYDELRRIARRYINRERPDHTLQPTALVHEAYLRLIGQNQLDWKNRAHFLAIAARTMRGILVDHAKGRATAKRGGNVLKVTLEVVVDSDATQSVDLVALDEALDRLDEEDRVKREVVELRYFGGLTIDETAAALEMSPGSVKRHWTTARAWLFRELEG